MIVLSGQLKDTISGSIVILRISNSVDRLVHSPSLGQLKDLNLYTFLADKSKMGLFFTSEKSHHIGEILNPVLVDDTLGLKIIAEYLIWRPGYSKLELWAY